MLRPEREVVILDKKDILKIEKILGYHVAGKALRFLKKVIYNRIARSQQGR